MGSSGFLLLDPTIKCKPGVPSWHDAGNQHTLSCIPPQRLVLRWVHNAFASKLFCGLLALTEESVLCDNQAVLDVPIWGKITSLKLLRPKVGEGVLRLNQA